jgi:hypothetical protein
MKLFILLAIIFFSFRVFSEDTYYYEGRYYKIDEYIRFLDDPDYANFVKEKKAEERAQRANVKDYFYEQEQFEAQQEKNRRQYLAELGTEPSDAELLKADAQHEKEKLAELKQFEALQKQYVAQQEIENRHQPTRMVASVFETDEEKPEKRIPLSKRKFVPKPKVQKKKSH